MKAWQVHELTGVDGLRLDEIAQPDPRPGEVVVRVRAIGMNSSELQLLEGRWVDYGVPPALPHIPGIEAAGEVVATGEGVRHLKPGDLVTTHYWWNCERCDECLSGWENTCTAATRYGRQVNGAYAEYTLLPAAFAIPLPAGLDCEAAAALTVAAGTAWHMLMVHGDLRAGETILVTGGASSIGTAAIEIAKLAGVRVIATAGHDWKLERLTALGAAHVINHTSNPDFAEDVLAVTDGRGVDLVYEAVGELTFGAGMAAVRPRGRIVIGGYMSGVETRLDLFEMIAREVRIYGSRSWSRATLAKVLELGARGQIAPVIDSRWALEQLPDALRKIQSREICGKVIVTA